MGEAIGIGASANPATTFPKSNASTRDATRNVEPETDAGRRQELQLRSNQLR